MEGGLGCHLWDCSEAADPTHPSSPHQDRNVLPGPSILRPMSPPHVFLSMCPVGPFFPERVQQHVSWVTSRPAAGTHPCVRPSLCSQKSS